MRLHETKSSFVACVCVRQQFHRGRHDKINVVFPWANSNVCTKVTPIQERTDAPNCLDSTDKHCRLRRVQYSCLSQQPCSGLDHLIVEISRSHTVIHTTVGRTSLDEGPAHRNGLYLTTHNVQNRQTTRPPAGFEPVIPASEWLQIHVSNVFTVISKFRHDTQYCNRHEMLFYNLEEK
jgi:hypothetical protein